MSLLARIRTSLETYGPAGRDSFEYIGLTVRDGELSSYKVYEQATALVETELRDTMPYARLLGALLHRFAAAEGIRYCDRSEEQVDGEQRYRLVYSLSRSLTQADIEERITTFFENLGTPALAAAVRQDAMALAQGLGTSTPRLQQLGVETDIKATLRVIKYYLDLTSDARRKPVCDRDFLQRLAASFGLDLERQTEALLEIAGHRYQPVFVGINRTQQDFERKLYFRSDAFGRQTAHVLPLSEQLAELLGWEAVITRADLRALHELGLYLQGIACTLGCAADWRLYFTYLPHWKHRNA